MENFRLFVFQQMLLTLFLAALSWSLYARLRKQEFFRWWVWAWTSFAAFLTVGAAALHLSPEWLLLRRTLVLLATLLGFLQVPLLVFAACSLRSPGAPSPKLQKAGVGLALSAGALTFALALVWRHQPLTSFSLRHILRTLALAAALVFCASVFLARWRRTRSPAAAVSGVFCVLYAALECIYSAALITHLTLGPEAPLRQLLDLRGLMRSPLFLLELFSSSGIALGMALLLVEEHRQSERALVESLSRGREIAERNTDLQREIDERLRVEQALRESEERYRALALASTRIVWRADAQGGAISISPSWQDLTGQSDAEMRGAGWLDVVHPDDRARVREAWEKAVAGGHLHEIEHRIRTRDGYRHFHVRGVPVRAADGSVREWIGANTDVTERRQAEDALRESQTRYRLATTAGNVGVWDLDLDTHEMYIDPALKALLGFQDGEIRNHLDDWIRRVHPDDLERITAEVQAHVEGASPAYEVEHRMLHKDGSVRWFLARGHAVRDADSRPRRLVGTDTDVTARKQAAEALHEVQARHRAILEALPDWMFLLTRDGVFLDCHARDPADLLAAPEEFLGRNMKDLLPPDVVAKLARCFAEAAESGGPCTLEYSLPIREGIRHYEARVVRCERDTVLSIVRDITARRRAEEEAHQLHDQLAHVGRVTVLGALTGSLAHEINQPLTAVMANAQAALRMIAERRPDLAEVRRTLADIVEANRRAGDVVQRLRSLLRKDAPEYAPLDVNATVEEVVRLVSSDILGRQVSLEVELAPRLSAVHGDRVQLQQVVVNLLLNAFDAVRDTEVGTRRVMLRTSGADQQVLVSVADRGVGVSEDRLSQIFEPFYTTKSEGLGLGLAICRAIVAAHGGVLSAERNQKGGMTFSFRLPASPEAPEAVGRESPKGGAEVTLREGI